MRSRLINALGLSTAALILAGCGGSLGGGQGIVANGPVPLNSNPLVAPPSATPPPTTPTPVPAPKPHPQLVVSPTWVPFGPNPGFDPFEQVANVSGRGTSLSVNPSNVDNMVLGTASGGIWTTTNGGGSWSPRSDSLPPAIGCLTRDPNNSSVVWAGTGEANLSGDAQPGFGLLKSTDGGQTWQQVPDTQGQFQLRSISRIVINPTNSHEMWVATTSAVLGGEVDNFPQTGQIYHSTDGGNTFTDISSGSAIGPDAPIVDLVYRPDTGALLAAVDTSMFQDFFLDVAPNDGRSGIYVSTNSGQTWTKSTQGLPAGTGIGRISLAVAPTQPTVVYALVGEAGTNSTTGLPNDAFSGLFVSANGGFTWQAMNLTPNPFTVPQGGESLIGDDFGAQQTQYNQFLVVDPSDATRLYMAGLAIVRVDSINLNGFTGVATALSQSNPQLQNGPHTDQHFAAIDANGNLYAIDDGGIYQLPDPSTANLSTAWNDLNTNIETLQFYTGSTTIDPFSLSLLGLGGTQDNGILSNMLSNGNQTFSGISNVWTEVFPGDGGGVAIDPFAPNVQYLTDGTFSFPYGPGFLQQAVTLPNTGQNGSTANVPTYNDISNGFNFSDPTSEFIPIQVSQQNEANMLVATTRIYESTNATADLNGGAQTVTFSDVSGILVTGNLTFPGTTNVEPDAFRAAAYAPSDDNVIFAVSAGGKVFRRQVRGQGFIECDFGIPAGTDLHSLSIDPNDSTHVVVASAQTTGGTFGVRNVPGRLFETNNSGLTWRDVTGDLPNLDVKSIVMDPTYNDVFYVGTFSGVFISQNDGGNWTPYGSGLPGVQVHALNILPQGQLAAYTHGRSMWATATSTLATVTGPSGAVTPHARGQQQGILRPHRHR